MNYKIIKAQYHDLNQILELQYLAYQSEAKLLNDDNIPPLKQTIEALQKEYERGIILKGVTQEGFIIASVRGYMEDNTLYIGKLMVHPNYRGQGIGTKLLAEFEGIYPKARYELFSSDKSLKNIELYQKNGYKICGEQQISSDLRFIYLEKNTSFSERG